MTNEVPPVELRPIFPALDTLRAVGALAVLTTHTAFAAGAYLRNGVFGALLARLDVGVAIFFVLSGFLLSRPYLARASLRLSWPSTRGYYEKRLLRIYPVYAIAAVAALALIPENSQLGFRRWLYTLLLADTYTQKQLPQGLTHMWSLAVEVAFYLILPALMVLALGRSGASGRRLGSLLVGMVGVSVLWHLVIAGWLEPQVAGAPGVWLPAYLTWFAAGISLAWIHVTLQRSPGTRWINAVPRLAAQPGLCWSFVAGLMLIASTPVAGPTLLLVSTPEAALTKHLIYAAIGTLVVMTGVWTSPGAYVRVMTSRIGRHLGHISYSVFCIHLSIITLVLWLTGYEPFFGHGIQIWLATVALTLVTAELVYRFVELPFLRIKRRVRPPKNVSDPHATENANSTTRPTHP